MVKTLGINSNNDIYLGSDGNIAVLSGIQAVKDACKTATQALLGEMVLATNQGIPYFQAVFIGTPKYAIYVAYLRSTLLGVPGVKKVKSLEMRVSNNTLGYTATIETDFGTVDLNVV